jgi:hypothetical protein
MLCACVTSFDLFKVLGSEEQMVLAIIMRIAGEASGQDWYIPQSQHLTMLRRTFFWPLRSSCLLNVSMRP